MALTKKQMQLWGGGAFGVVIGLVLLIQFVVMPMVANMKKHRADISALREELDKAGEVIGTGTELQRNLGRDCADISVLSSNIPLPVLGNYLLEMEEQIRSCCVGINIRIISVADHDVINAAGWNSLFKIYRIRVVAQAGINDLAQYLEAIQKSNPFLSIMTLNIIPQADVPDVHNVNFIAGWLIWSDVNNRPSFLTEPKAGEPSTAQAPVQPGKI